VESSSSWRKTSHSESGNCVEVGGYRVSSRSGGNGQCVEVGSPAEFFIAIRDTKEAGDRNRATVRVPAWSWREFTAGIKMGR
jgi:hypothetical protein